MVLILFLDAPMELLGVCNCPTTSHPPLYYDMSNTHGRTASVGTYIVGSREWNKEPERVNFTAVLKLIPKLIPSSHPDPGTLKMRVIVLKLVPHSHPGS